MTGSHPFLMKRIPRMNLPARWILLAGFLFAGWQGLATPDLPPWTPLFKGIEFLTATNVTRSSDFQNRMVAFALKIDLRDPDIRLLSSPPITNHLVNFRETAGRTVSQFLRTNELQAVINAGFFNPGEYYLPEGTPMTVNGLLISQGESVSPANFSYSACLLVDADNQARIVATNPHVLDGVIDPAFGNAEIDRDAIAARIRSPPRWR